MQWIDYKILFHYSASLNVLQKSFNADIITHCTASVHKLRTCAAGKWKLHICR